MRHFILSVATVLLALFAFSQPASYYVNDNSTLSDVFTTAPGNNSNPGTASAPFASINHAISVAQNGDIIYVDAGIYEEHIVVNKSITLRGAQFGNAPGNSLNRGGESVVMPSTSNSLQGIGIAVNAIDVVIDGFLLDGDNPSLTGGISINGTDANAGLGLNNQQFVVDGMVVKNNIIKNFVRYGIFLQRNTPAGALTENIQILNNHVDNISSASNNGRGIAFFANAHGSIKNNFITRSATGIVYANHTVASTLPVTVENNTVESYLAGVHFQALSASSSSVVVSGNSIVNANQATWSSPGSNPTANGTGLLVLGLNGSGDMILSNNNITGKREGFNISDITVPNGVQFTGGGVYNSTVIGGFVITGKSAVSFSNFTFDNNPVGLDASASEAPVLSLSFSNTTFNGGTTGIRFYGNALSLPGNALTGVSFNNQSGAHLYQTYNAFQGQVIDASAAIFNGQAAGTMTSAQLLALEDKVDHAMDYNDVGYFKFKPTELFVTANSFKSNLPLVFGTPTTAPDINRAVALAGAGNTIHIGAGTFENEIKINKALTLKGQGRDLTTINGPASLSTPEGFGEKAIIHSTQGAGWISIQSLAVTGGASNEQHSILIQGPGEVKNCELKFVNNGIYFRDPGTVTGLAVANGNYMHDLGFVGINFAGSAMIATMFNNTIDMAGSLYGMGVISGTDMGPNAEFSASNNIVRNFNGWGIYANANTTSISFNSITGTGYLLNTFMPGPVNATCNWFGTTDANVIQNQMAGNFNYSPWLVSGVDTDLSIEGFQPPGNVCTGRQNKFYVNDASQSGDVFTSAIGNDANKGLASQPFATISKAFNTAFSGDTIFVDAGTYIPGDVFISKSLTILGPNYLTSPNNPANRLQVNPARNAEATINGSSISVGAAGLTIKGFSFIPGAKIQISQLSTAPDFDNLLVENNRFVSTASQAMINVSGRGITPLATSNYQILNNRFERANTGNGTDIFLNYLSSAKLIGNVHTVASPAFARLQSSITLGSTGKVDSVIIQDNIFDRANGAFNSSRLGLLSANSK